MFLLHFFLIFRTLHWVVIMPLFCSFSILYIPSILFFPKYFPSCYLPVWEPKMGYSNLANEFQSFIPDIISFPWLDTDPHLSFLFPLLHTDHLRLNTNVFWKFWQYAVIHGMSYLHRSGYYIDFCQTKMCHILDLSCSKNM